MSDKFSSVKKEYWSRKRQQFLNRFKKEEPKPDLNALTITERVAFVIDDEVVDIIVTQPKFAAILLSEPLILDVNNIQVAPGYKYINGEFVPPSNDEEAE